MTKARTLLNIPLMTSVALVLVLAFVLVVGKLTPWVTIVAILALGVAVMTGVHHAEVIASRVGPSLGALVLAISVTVIEVGLITSLMLVDSPDSAVVARDTVFSAIIIVTNGIVGVCLLLGGLKYHEIGFQVQGASSLLCVLAALSGLTLVLPNYTTTTGGGTYSDVQLIFASAAALLLYIALVLSQTRTHKDYFEGPTQDMHAQAHLPSRSETWISFVGLLMSLSVVIGLAKSLSPAIEFGVSTIGAPREVVGIVIALLVLAPETWAAISAARANQLQTSLNLALGSGAASIALTIPVVAIFSVMTGRSLVLGLDAKSTAFLALTFIVGGLTLGTGRTTALQGAVHLVLLAAYLVLAFIP